MMVSRTRIALGTMMAIGSIALASVSVSAAGPAALTAVVTANDNATPTPGKVWVRVLHASPDAPSVDVYVGAALSSAAKVDALSGIEFGDITDYAEVDPGTYAIKVCATADASVCPIQVAALDLTADTKVTIAASDLLASIKADVFVDDPDASETTAAQVRVVHLSADTPAVDVLTQAGDSIGIDGLEYPDRAPATGYASFPAGSYDLKVCASADNAVCPLDPGALDLAAGQAYTVFAIGSLAAAAPSPSPAASPAGSAAVTPPATDTVVADSGGAPGSPGDARGGDRPGPRGERDHRGHGSPPSCDSEDRRPLVSAAPPSLPHRGRSAWAGLCRCPGSEAPRLGAMCGTRAGRRGSAWVGAGRRGSARPGAAPARTSRARVRDMTVVTAVRDVIRTPSTDPRRYGGSPPPAVVWLISRTMHARTGSPRTRAGRSRPGRGPDEQAGPGPSAAHRGSEI